VLTTGELQGVWWLPGSPEHVVSGTLTLAENERPTLLVVGPIDAKFDLATGLGTLLGRTQDLPFVFGRAADGKKITLSNVRLGIRQLHLDDPRSAIFELVGWSAFVGAHADPDKAVFKQADVVLERLADWLDERAMDLEVTPSRQDARRISIIGELPGTTRVAVEGGEFLARTNLASSGDFRRTATLTMKPSLRITLNEAITTDAWFKTWLVPTQRLVALATSLPIEIERLELTSPDDHQCEFWWPRALRAGTPDRLLMPDEVLFTLPDLNKGDLAEHLRCWLSATTRFEPVLNMFFATRYAERMFEEDRFQNLIQAVEAYHRRVSGARPNQVEHEKRAKALLATVPAEHREWLSEVLETTKEFRLSDRIEALLNDHAWMVDDVIPHNLHRWAVRAAMARNFRAHHDPDASPIGTNVDDLVGFNQRLATLLEACFLHELGLPEDRVREMIRRASPSYRMLKLNPDL
jgi:ApeA N-terminal domain 1